jgi:hypothetical protein
MKFFNLFFLLSFLFISANLSAGSKRTDVDLDIKTTEIVRADLDIDNHYYYIDPTACICWVSRLIGGSNSTATFDCSKLLAYKKLENHLKNCKPVKQEIVEEVKNLATEAENLIDGDKNNTKDTKDIKE